MTSTRQLPRAAPRYGARDEPAEDLRRVFRTRLQTERVHLVTLSAALAQVEDSPAWIFHDLRDRAHKIRGAAAVFEVAEVAAAARELEQASLSASMSHADNTDAAVWTALVALVRLLGAYDSGDNHTHAAAPQQPAASWRHLVS